MDRRRIPDLVTTGLDPVVHAERRHQERRVSARYSPKRLRAVGMDCRVKPGNDEGEAWLASIALSPPGHPKSPSRTSSPPGLTRWSMLSVGAENVASAHDILAKTRACVPSVWIGGSSPAMTKERVVSLSSPRRHRA
jgi:hypothetical protein